MTYFLTIDEVLAIRDRIMEETGGRKGILDFTLLHSAVERPKATFGGIDLYPDIFAKASALMHSLIQNHPFNDGNKRTALAVTVRFLYLNGFKLKASTEKIVKFTMQIQHHQAKFEDISYWLKAHSRKIRS